MAYQDERSSEEGSVFKGSFISGASTGSRVLSIGNKFKETHE